MKKTLILNGSPRRGGDTAALLERLIPMLEGEIRQINAYHDGIRPCIDCRACQKSPGCAVRDGMTAVYDAMGECDSILVASPVYFRNLTPPMLNILSRMQVNYAAEHFHGADLRGGRKRGAVLLVGGGSGRPDLAQITASILLHQMNAWDLHEPVLYLDTDRRPAALAHELDGALRSVADFFNGQK